MKKTRKGKKQGKANTLLAQETAKTKQKKGKGKEKGKTKKT